MMNSTQTRIPNVEHRKKAESIALKLGLLETNKTKTLTTQNATRKEPTSTHSPDLRIFVKNIRADTSETTLKGYFGQFGVVTDVFIRQSDLVHSGNQCKMAYITFASFHRQHPMSLPVHIIDGLRVYISEVISVPNAENEKAGNSKTVMITGAIHTTPDLEIKKYFKKCGPVDNVFRKPDPDNPGTFGRFAFVCFTSPSSAEKASEEKKQKVNGQVVDVRRVMDR